MTEYTVKRQNRNETVSGEKHLISIENRETKEEVVSYRMSFSSWQLDENYKDRLRQSAENRLNERKLEFSGIVVEADIP